MNNKIIFSGVLVVIVLLFTVLAFNQSPKVGSGIISPPVATYATSTQYTITTNSTYVEATTSRQYYNFANPATSTRSTIWLSFMQGAPAVVGRGIMLTASSTFEMSVQKGNAYYGAITAISDNGSAVNLVVTGY